MTLTAPRAVRGSLVVPGDKSISHRAVLLNALAHGTARISNFLNGADCRSTVACVRALGVAIEHEGDTLEMTSAGLPRLTEPADVLDCGNSGTTLRLLTGLLAGVPLFAVLTGDASLRTRPQRRIVAPLRALGSHIEGRHDGSYAPLAVRGTRLHGGNYALPIASAQVKSALLLAAIGGDAPLTLTGRLDSRDHTERMLVAMGVDLRSEHDSLTLHPHTPPRVLSLRVPGDPSSAAFWWVAAAIHPDAEVTTCGVCLNPTRTGALDVLRAMGADVTIADEHQEGCEPVGDVTVRSSALHATEIGGALIPRLIDEVPVLAVAAACAEGTTIIRDAQELRVKETDRIAAVAEGLMALGAAVTPTEDGMRITGRPQRWPLRGAHLHSSGDHRLAMAWAIAALVAQRETTISGTDAVTVSYPTFWQTLQTLTE
jgi:3-phosphoshikimate 1-carboxyvinyltransferase